MLRIIAVVLLMTVSAVAFHDNTFAVFSLKEELQIRFMNLWELFQQLEYVEPHQREVVYQEIQHIRAEIQRIIDELILLDKAEH